LAGHAISLKFPQCFFLLLEAGLKIFDCLLYPLPVKIPINQSINRPKERKINQSMEKWNDFDFIFTVPVGLVDSGGVRLSFWDLGGLKS
jgi:hypothetical protein